MSNGEPEKTPSQQEQREGCKAPQVLLVEDNEAMRAMLAQALSQAGYQVTECADGGHWLNYCLRKATQASQEGDGDETYDVVVSDIRMPKRDGLEVLSFLNSEEFAPHCPPTIFITAFGDEETHEKALALGAVCVLDKPFPISALIEKIRSIAAS